MITFVARVENKPSIKVFLERANKVASYGTLIYHTKGLQTYIIGRYKLPEIWILYILNIFLFFIFAWFQNVLTGVFLTISLLPYLVYNKLFLYLMFREGIKKHGYIGECKRIPKHKVLEELF